MDKHIPNLLSAAWIVLLCWAAIAISRIVRPRRKRPEETARVVEIKPVPISLGFRQLIVLSTVLGAGLLLLYPVATVFKEKAAEGQGPRILAIALIFCVLLCVALAHAWIKGDLAWISREDRDGTKGRAA